MFGIAGNDIAQLRRRRPAQFGGRLCEAELHRRNLSTSAITWGGDQGRRFNVRVALPAGTPIDVFIPKPNTGFQVKKLDMPHGEIFAEMKLKGEVRPVIVELAKTSGRLPHRESDRLDRGISA